MIDQKEKKWFGDPQTGGLNSDDADFSLGVNQWLNAENVRVGTTDSGVINTVESIGSTVQLSEGLPSQTFTCIGVAEDTENSRFIYFLYNTTGHWHRIMCYDINAGQVYTVLLSSQVTGGLSFNKNNLIHSARVVNRLLYWTDGLNRQRKINIDSGIKLNNPNYVTSADAYSVPLSQDVISLIKRPPMLPLSINKVTDGTVLNNFIENNAFQFSARYYYKDGETSVLSTYSKLANYNKEADTYNAVDVTFSFSEHIDQDVQRVNLIVRFGNTNNFFVIKSWNKDNSTDNSEINAHNNGVTALTYRFYNDILGEPIDPAYALKPFDSVPITSDTLEVAKDRLYLANNVSGYDTPTSTSLAATTATASSPSVMFKTGATYQPTINFYDYAGRKCGIVTKEDLKLDIPDRGYSTTNFVNAINWTLSNNNALTEIPDWAYYYSININQCLLARYFLQLRGLNCSYLKKNSNNEFVLGTPDYDSSLAGCAFDITTLSSFKMGYVFTEGDFVNIYISGSSTVYKLAIIGQGGGYIYTELQDLGTLNATNKFLFQIYTPYKPSVNEPSFEEGYIYKINSPATFGRQYSTISGTITGDTQLLTRTSVNRVLYTINTVDEKRNDDQLATLGVLYTAQDAASSSFSTGSSPFRSLAGFNIATNNNRWIIRNDSAGDLKLRIAGFVKLTPDSNRTWRMYVEDNVSNKTVLVPDTVMVANLQKTLNFDTEVTLGAGRKLFVLHFQSVANSMYFKDLSMVISVPDDNITYLAETMSPNDKFYKNWYTNAGRPNFIQNIGQVEKTNSISFSETYIAGTRVNGLSSFNALNEKPIPLESGHIQKLQLTSKVQNEQGVVMLVICEKETASLYLGEVQQYGSNAQTTLTIADQVIGTINVLRGSFGTLNPESVVEFRGGVYWVDVANGKVIQYASNGLFPISEYKMTRFWKLFSDLYLSLTTAEIEALGSRPFIFGTVDYYHSELLFSIPKLSNTPPKGYLPDYSSTIYPFDIWDATGKTIVYKLNANPNFWIGAYSFNPEYFISLQNKLYSFQNGILYQHNQIGHYNQFYGVQYQSKIMFVCNQPPNIVKSYNSINIESNDGTLLPSLTYFRSETPYQQASDLLDFQYTNYEGVLYATLMRNKLIPTATGYNTNGLLTQEKMRTSALKVMLVFSVTNVPLELRYVTIGFTISQGHKT